MIGVIIGGSAVLIVVAILIGMSSSDRTARDSAWRRVADARRLNAELARSNQDRLTELSNWAGELQVREQQLNHCETCPRRFGPDPHRS